MQLASKTPTGIKYVQLHAMPPIYLAAHKKYKNIRTQNAMNIPIIMPSLRFFADILPIKLFKPGTWLAAPVILLLMLAKVSLCNPKLSLTAYAWLSTLSAMLLLLSIRALSSSIYSASA